MSDSIRYFRPSEEEMARLVVEWWDELDKYGDSNNGKIPMNSIKDKTGEYAFLYGHYDQLGPSGFNEGVIEEDHKGLKLLTPLVNGRYGTGLRYDKDMLGEDITTGVLMSRYVSEMYASVQLENKVSAIPQGHWITQELPNSTDLANSDVVGFYYGTWICIDGSRLENGSSIKFGGKGGPNALTLRAIDSKASLSSNLEGLLSRFETKASWNYGTKS